MIGGLPIGFAEPLVLVGLITLPVLWWLLRLIPPRPKRVEFPPTRLLFDITPKEDTPARTPWWLTALRLSMKQKKVMHPGSASLLRSRPHGGALVGQRRRRVNGLGGLAAP